MSRTENATNGLVLATELRAGGYTGTIVVCSARTSRGAALPSTRRAKQTGVDVVGGGGDKVEYGCNRVVKRCVCVAECNALRDCRSRSSLVVVAHCPNPAFLPQAAGTDAVLSKGQRLESLLRLLRGDAERSAGCKQTADLPLTGPPGAADEVWATDAADETWAG